MKQIKIWLANNFSPLQQLLLVGCFVRLLSVIFSKGFGWHDDHFLIIETSQSWVDGYHNFWLPTEAEPNRLPQGHALFYIGIHYYILEFFTFIKIHDPQIKMTFIRLLHALWSLLIISYGYRIAKQHATEKTAWYVGLFLAVYWFMPFISVRNLVEFVCVPPCLIAIYLLGQKNQLTKNYLLAGMWLGIAFSIRFQSLFITAGIGLALLLMKRSIIKISVMAIAFSIIVFLTQGVVDIIIWKKPFTEFLAYVEYNVNNATAYGTDNWHMYFDLIFGMLLPPLSFVLVAGYFKTFKSLSLIFWPVLLYLAFHTYFPNKQERFVMTVMPLIIISGTVGAFELYQNYRAKINNKLLLGSKYFVVGLNCIALMVLTFSYSKRHKVEAMYYLYKKQDAKNVMIEDSNRDNEITIPPLYYAGFWKPTIGITKYYNADSALLGYKQLPNEDKPNYVVFWQANNIKNRVDSLQKRFPNLVYETTIEPSSIDKLLFFLNPLNDNQTAYIYKLK